MKRYIFLLIVMLFFVACKKVELTNLTGTLRVDCSLVGNDYENVQIAIYPYENHSYALYFGHPGNDGVYKQELLQGNYNIEISYKELADVSAIQIIGGEESEVSIAW